MNMKNIRGRKLNKREEIKVKTTSITRSQLLIGTFLLLIGVLLGVAINLNSTFALETATASNATSSNATSSNATSSNVQPTDNIMYLNNLSLGVDSVKAGDKVYVNKSTSGACNSAMSITFTNQMNNNSFSVKVEDINKNPYFIVPDYVISGNYKITNVFLVGVNSDDTTFTKKFGINNSDSDIINYDFNINLLVAGNETQKVELKKISLASKSALVGDKINLSFDTTITLTSLKLLFKSNKGNEFTTYVNSFDSNPYFVVPVTAKEDNYYLNQVTLVTKNSSNVYTNGVNYNFNTTLEIKHKEDVYVFNNNDITDNMIKYIYDGDDNIEIEITADDNPVISKELFNAIKGTNKKIIIYYKNNQIIFLGNDIESTKSIDVSVTTNIINKDKDIEKLINDGVVINFASNGNLPGKALIKIRVTDEMRKTFGNNKIYIYYYDELEKGFNEIAKEITSKDGYYEFTISHNSKYVLTKTEIDDKLIIENKNDENVISFQASNKHYLLLIGISAMLIIVVVAIILIIKKKNRKR